MKEEKQPLFCYSYFFEEDRLQDYADECYGILSRRWAVRHTKKQRLRPLHPALMILVILIFLVSMIQIMEDEMFLNIATYLTLVILVLLLWLVISILLKYRMRSRMRKNKGSKGELRIYEDTFEDSSEDGQLHYSYADIKHIVIGRDIVLFYTGQKIFMFVCRNEPDDKALIRFLKERFPNKMLYWQYGQD